MGKTWKLELKQSYHQMVKSHDCILVVQSAIFNAHLFTKVGLTDDIAGATAVAEVFKG